MAFALFPRPLRLRRLDDLVGHAQTPKVRGGLVLKTRHGSGIGLSAYHLDTPPRIRSSMRSMILMQSTWCSEPSVLVVNVRNATPPSALTISGTLAIC